MYASRKEIGSIPSLFQQRPDLSGTIVAKQGGDLPRVHGEVQLVDGQLGTPDRTPVDLRQT